ncbi:MAG: iron ABC transporter permease [Anaerolineales bacterium]
MNGAPDRPEELAATAPPKRLLGTALLWLAPVTFLLLFYFFPMEEILRLSFGRDQVGAVSAFAHIFGSPSIRRIIGFTLSQAALSTALTLLVGLPGAYLFGRYTFRGKAALRALTGIPFVLPTLVVAAAFNALMGPTGWLNLGLMRLLGASQPPIGFTNTLAAILIAHVFYNTTIVLRMVGDFWSHLDPRIESAARSLGANRWQTLTQITLPLLSPAILTAALLVFIFDFTSFGVVLVLGGPQFATLEVEIFRQTVSLFNLPVAAGLSVVQLIFTLGLTIAYTRLAERSTQPLPLQSRRVTQRRPTGARQRAMTIAISLLLLVLLVSPLLALAGRSVVGLGGGRPGEVAPQGLTLAFYRALADKPQSSLFYVAPTQAVRNSLRIASLTVLLALVLGTPASWALAYRRRSALSRWIDPILMLPLGTSAVTLGLGFILALDTPPLDLRTSPWLLPIAHTLVALPFVVRSLTPALRSIQPRLRQAAAVLGAAPLAVIRYIDLPLVARALLVAAAFAFTISLGEFGATALLARPEQPTVPVVIYRFLSRPGGINFGQALALSTLLMVVTGAGMFAIERFRIADVGEF